MKNRLILIKKKGVSEAAQARISGLVKWKPIKGTRGRSKDDTKAILVCSTRSPMPVIMKMNPVM